MTHQDPARETWSCTIAHFDGNGNRIPCPDSLTVPEPELPKPEAESIRFALDAIQAHRQKPRRGCSVLPFLAFLAVVLLSSWTGPAQGAEPEPSGEVGTVLLGGKATWYETPGHTAAAGPVLRDVLGDWRGRYVTVEAGDRSVVVKLTDFCACRDRAGVPTLLDLSKSAFAVFADPSVGVIRVSIEISGDTRPDPADDRMRVEDGGPLPATDTLGAVQ